MSDAASPQKDRRGYQKHGDSRRVRCLRGRGLSAIDARTVEGREALAWRDAVLKAKGGHACPYAIKVAIALATFDLWRLLCLQAWLIADANARGTIINRRKRELPNVHAQYDQIDARFLRRIEALDLGRGSTGMDLASRLAAAQRTQESIQCSK
jgi:hypothetical protein